MNQNANELKAQEDLLKEWADLDESQFDFDELEEKLESNIEEKLEELKGLELDHEKIGTPNAIGDVIKDVMHQQVVNQFGVEAGEEFIKKNNGLKLDLRKDAHIQTTENFAKGKIANHNTHIDYQKRYDDWQDNFQHDDQGNVITHTTRSGKQEATLVSGARAPYDNGRPVGNKENGTAMDHTISAAEDIRDPRANAHMSKEERIAFLNSEDNINEMNASHNQSKGDKSMSDWLDNPNSKGQTPREVFGDPSSKDYLSEELEQEYRKKDEEARAEYEKKKKEAEQRSIQAGKQSRKEEAFRISGEALKAAIRTLLYGLIVEIIKKLVVWFKSGEKKLQTFLDSLKNAFQLFVSNLTKYLRDATDAVITAIATAIIGPIVGLIKKAWIFLKQGYKSLKQAIDFLRDPKNKNKPFRDKMEAAGKIVIVGLTAGSAIALGEVITIGLKTIPPLAIEIPLFGSIAGILGIFLGGLVTAIIGALALNVIDRMVAKRQKAINEGLQIEKGNDIIVDQQYLIEIKKRKLNSTKSGALDAINERHKDATNSIKADLEQINRNSEEINAPIMEEAEIIEEPNEETNSGNVEALSNLFAELNNLNN